jgi:hypothetical protein
MLKAIGTLLVALAVTTLPAKGAPEKISFVRFQTPSKNIGCLYSTGLDRRPAYLRCDVLSGLKPQPRRACELDWTGYTLLLRGVAWPTCAGDTVYDQKTRILGLRQDVAPGRLRLHVASLGPPLHERRGARIHPRARPIAHLLSLP